MRIGQELTLVASGLGKSIFWSLEFNMRNLVISRITDVLVESPDLQVELDISPEELESLSNEELLDLFEEIFGFQG